MARWLLGVVLSASLCAQRARLVGTVHDPSGAAVPAVTVRAQNAATGLAWRTLTSEDGAYNFDLLPPGIYHIEASAPNFTPAEARDVRLAVNASQRVDLTLAIAAFPQKVEARAVAPVVETETSEAGAVIGERLIHRLPLNGRDFLQLATLAPGVSRSLDVPSSPSGPFNVNGQRDLSNHILIDGVSVNAGGSSRGRISLSPGSDTAAGQSGSSLSLISIDSLTEFKVQTQLYAAEYGSYSGAIVNVQSKSGTNDFHGSAYEFLRNSALDANNFFFNANGRPKPPARNNLFGATAGGPIRRDRTFFFGSFEGLRQRLGVSSNARVPSLAARAAASAAVQPLIQLYPLPTEPDRPDGTAPYFAASSNLVGETTFSVRADHRLTATDDLFARYSFSDSLGDIRSFYLNFLTHNRTRLQNATLAWTRPNNEARLGFVRSANATLGELDAFGGARAVPLDAEGNATLPGLLVFSLPFAVAHNPPFLQNNNLFSWSDNVTLVRGRHHLRLGAWVRRVQGNIDLKPLSSGVYFFDTVDDLVANNPSFFFNQVALTGFGIRFTNVAFYAQDDWALTRRLKINAGLRYELHTVPAEAHGRFTPFRNGTLGRPGEPLHNADHNNLAPRLGFAYQATGRTVLRGGAGIYYDMPTLNAFQPALGPPFKITNFLPGTKFGGPVRVPVDPALLPSTIAGRPPYGSANVYDPENFRTPYTYHYNLTVQRELDRHTLVQAGFAGALGRRLIRFRPIESPDFSPGALELIETTAASSYHALQLHANRRLHRGLELLASYTYSHSLDDVSNGTGTSVVSSFTGSNPNNLRAEHASSDFDVRQNLSIGFSYVVWRGWSLEGIFHAQTALPYTPLLGRDVAGNGDQNAANNQRPNLVPGQPLYLRSSAPPFRVANPAAFAAPAPGTYGDAGRNILRASGMHQLDLGVLKDLRLAERLGLQFRAEFFNLLNHANFATPAASGNHLLTAGASFGLSQQMASESAGGFLGPLFQSGGPRSLQFGLKLLW